MILVHTIYEGIYCILLLQTLLNLRYRSGVTMINNYVLYARIIFCYLSITVGICFYHISAFSSLIDHYIIIYVLYFIVLIISISNLSHCAHTYIVLLYSLMGLNPSPIALGLYMYMPLQNSRWPPCRQFHLAKMKKKI